MDSSKLIDELVRDEGLELKVYVDSRSDLPQAWTDARGKRGLPTLGIGRNLLGRGITREEAYFLAQNDIENVTADLDQHLPWWRDLDEVRQRVIANMCFNMGIVELLRFHTTLALIQQRNFVVAADHMLLLPWARQTGERAKRLAQMLRTGQAV